ncbi:transient receptor potential channel pyrexia-like isoform X1 [Coccinella septempunctata]|uniref:transient receptor potential channel pyrexia-like isoform X1 n=1 Tax=Coccinella septempunctata TaxID=41139 RepID=UPI001D0799E1|nr:transient receptor potential channel pyrexia-like isoform X1 [Coccinella septempunctata]
MPNTSSHQSSHLPNIICIESLIQYLDDGGDVNQTDEMGNTLLHVTIFHNKAEKKKNEEIIEVLLGRGANPNLENKFGETPLYVAIWHSNNSAVANLLKAGAELVFQRENALHLAAEVGYVPNVELLLASSQFQSNTSLVNTLDYDGYSPAYRAALTGHKFSLKLLALAGADLSFKIKDRTIMEVIFDEITRPEDWFVDLLDEGITCEVDAQTHSYVVDLKVLAPNTNERQLEVLVDLIGAANLQEENVVLQHPLIEFLLILKWAKLCYFYYYVLCTYTIFALSLSLYGSSLNKMIGGCDECDEASFHFGITMYRGMAIVSGFLIFCHVALQSLLNPKKFLKFDNLLTAISLIAAIVVAVVGENFGHLRESDAPDWVLQVISVLLLFLWMELMSLLGRLPVLGYYAIMFTTVLKNVLKVLSIFICLLLGFALSFSIQFHNSPEFSNPWKALVKTTVMMAGEFEYSDLYSNTDSDNIYALILSRFLFLMFIVLNSIVLMNLMIALAASDIQTLQVQSHARKMKKQAYFLYHMEKLLLCKQLTASYVPSLIARFLRSRRRVKTRYEFTKSMRHSRYLPTTLIEHIKRIGKEHKKVLS